MSTVREIATRIINGSGCSFAENSQLAAHVLASPEPECRLGVGDASGKLFVRGDYDSVKAAQQIILERDDLRAQLQAAQHAITIFATDTMPALIGQLQPVELAEACAAEYRKVRAERYEGFQKLQAAEQGRLNCLGHIHTYFKAMERIANAVGLEVESTHQDTIASKVCELQQLADERGRVVERLSRVALALCDRLDAMEGPVNGKLAISAAHGFAYTGPNWGEPLKAMREVLSTPAAMPPAPSRDWIEDASQENGNYQNTCVLCEQVFIGHKRRVCCKVCASLPPAQEHPDTKSEWRISYEYCQRGLLGTQHEEWDSFSIIAGSKEACDGFVAAITDEMHRNIRTQSRGPWTDAARTAPEAQG